MSEQNMKIVRRLLDEVWTQGNLALLPELVAEEAISHPMPQMGAMRGPQEYMNFIAIIKGAFRAMDFTIEDQFATDNKVATRWISRATGASGEATQDAATGEQVTTDGITITHHDSNGKVIAEWTTWDTQSLLSSAAAPHIHELLAIKV